MHPQDQALRRMSLAYELKWNGAKLIDAETMLGWAKQMTWKGLHPVVELSHQVRIPRNSATQSRGKLPPSP